MAKCIGYHSDDCVPIKLSTYPATRTAKLNVLRAVDVVKNCIVRLPCSARYLTLSYVWGDCSSVRITNKNLADYMTKGSLKKARDKLPRTITDAIDLVYMLEKRYLWVDTLCLISDDEVDMARGISIMDMIYEGSSLNIIAAAGFDANAGLPGVRYGSRRGIQYFEEVQPGVKMGITWEVGQHLASSRYATRGWTFQEQILPKRSVIFTDEQVYWRCRFTEWSEATTCDKVPTKSHGGKADLLQSVLSDTEESPLDSYETLLVYYSRRKLTQESDTLNAMEGLLNRLALPLNTGFLQGLPRATFDRSILFETESDESKDGLSYRRLSFASYSWAGWRNRIRYDQFKIRYSSGTKDKTMIHMNEWLEQKTWIIWYESRPEGTISLVWDSEAEDAHLKTSEYDMRYPKKRIGRLQRFSSLCNDFSTKPSCRSIPPRPYPVLIFWTMAVYFPVSSYNILDRNNQSIGTVDLKYDPSSIENKRIEFLVLSEYTGEYPIISTPHSSLAIENGLEWNGYWVLAVRYVDDGIMERIGLGRILQSALPASYAPGPVWKENILG